VRRVIERAIENVPKFISNDFHITDRIDISLDVNNFSIIESTCKSTPRLYQSIYEKDIVEIESRLTNDLEDSIDRSHIGQEIVSQSSTGRSTFGQTGDIDASENGGYFRRRLVLFTKPIESSCKPNFLGQLECSKGEEEKGRGH